MKRFLTVLLALIALGSLLGNLLLYRRYSTARPVASMKGGSVTIKDYRDRLEFLHGQEVLTKMVLRKVVSDAARAAGVEPTEEDVDHRIDFIKRRNPQQLQAAMSNPILMAETRDNLKSDIALESLTIKDIQATPAEVEAFYQRSRALFSVPDQTLMTVVTAVNQTDANTAKQLLQQKVDAMSIANQPRLGVVGLTVQLNWGVMPAGTQERLTRQASQTPAGGVFFFTIPGDQIKFLVVRIDKQGKKGIAPLAEVKGDVERLCRLAKAQRQGRNTGTTMLEVYKAAGVRFDTDRYAQYLSRISEAAQNAGAPAAPAKP